MSNIDVITMAIRNLFKRKLRTFLTVLGVVIGTSAIIIMISLGIAINESFESQMDNMGDITVIRVNNPNYYAYDAMTAYDSKSTELNDKAVGRFKEIDGVKTATPLINSYLRFTSGKYVMDQTVLGIDPAAMKEFTFNIEEGRILEDEDQTKLNVVFGGEIPYFFYNPNDRNSMSYRQDEGERKPPKVSVMDDRINMTYDYSYGERRGTNDSTSKKKVRPYSVTVVGLLKSGYWDTDYSIYMPIKQLQKIITEKENYEKSQSAASGMKQNNIRKGYEEVLVKCENLEDVFAVKEKIEEMGFGAYTQMDWINSMKEVSNSLQVMLGAIGGVSLLIAAIGITNTMIMSIYERTKEIGVMKVIGADIRDIKKIFLIEAMLIGFIGGLIGISLSLGVSHILNSSEILFLDRMTYSEMNKVSSIPLELCISALCFSSIIGLISGYFPARRAMKLSALSAIRTE